MVKLLTQSVGILYFNTFFFPKGSFFKWHPFLKCQKLYSIWLSIAFTGNLMTFYCPPQKPLNWDIGSA